MRGTHGNLDELRGTHDDLKPEPVKLETQSYQNPHTGPIYHFATVEQLLQFLQAQLAVSVAE